MFEILKKAAVALSEQDRPASLDAADTKKSKVVVYRPTRSVLSVQRDFAIGPSADAAELSQLYQQYKEGIKVEYLKCSPIHLARFELVTLDWSDHRGLRLWDNRRDDGAVLVFEAAIHNSIDAIADEAQRRGEIYAGIIELSLRIVDDESLIVEMRDNGIGMSPDILNGLHFNIGSGRSSKPSLELGARLGGKGMGFSTLCTLVWLGRGSLEINTYHPGFEPYMRVWDFTGQQVVALPAFEGKRESFGTTIRWKIPI